MKDTDAQTSRPTGSAIRRLLKSIAQVSELSERIERISGEFLGRPYAANTLGGGAGLPEHLVINLDAFDCVTYLETVFALALSATEVEFRENLRRIRYYRGEVSWATRNHYMVDWWENNEAEGMIQNITLGSNTSEKQRNLSVIDGLPEKSLTLRVFPRSKIISVKKIVKTGDFICFASTKKNLDVFHTGILVCKDEEVILRHATRSKGAVVEQLLVDFLKSNSMSGLVILRPFISADNLI